LLPHRDRRRGRAWSRASARSCRILGWTPRAARRRELQGARAHAPSAGRRRPSPADREPRPTVVSEDVAATRAEFDEL